MARTGTNLTSKQSEMAHIDRNRTHCTSISKYGKCDGRLDVDVLWREWCCQLQNIKEMMFAV